MRLAFALLVTLCTTCSLVVSDRTPAYEGACAGEEEAAKSRYDGEGLPAEGLGSRSILNIALGCPACATEDCVEACILETIHRAITLECSACFADAAVCTSEICRGRCSGDLIDIDDCNHCVCENDCGPALNACAGVTAIVCRE